MWFVPPELRLQVMLLVATLAFGAYGCSEMREAWQDGRSLRAGTEGVVVAGVFLAILIVVSVFKRRRPRRSHLDLL